MTVLARDIYKDVSAELQDSQGTRWPWLPSGARPNEACLQDRLNSALLQLATQRPDAVAVTTEFALSPGTMQTLPADALCLLDILYVIQNSQPGKAVHLVDKASLDPFLRTWYAGRAAAPDNYAYDKLVDPRIFWVYPGAPATPVVQIKMTYARTVTPMTAETSALPVADTYKSALVHWILYKIFLGDTAIVSQQKALHHYQAWFQELGLKLPADMMFMPTENGPVYAARGKK